MEFYKLAPGAEFEFQGKRFMKVAMSMAWDEKRHGTISRVAVR